MSIKRSFSELRRGLWSLLFPHLCLHCRKSLVTGLTPALCVNCTNTLALTRHWELTENDLTDRFTGRLPLVFGAALYYFRVGSVCQSVIHALKYHHRPEIGVQLGALFGTLLREVPSLQDLDGIVPVPIHPKRLHERGYNQAEHIAAGLASSLGISVYAQALVRTSFKGSQTKRDRLARLDNVSQSFAVGSGDFSGQHLLLVDDVVTTGATLDFCGNLLVENHAGCRLSIAALALAD